MQIRNGFCKGLEHRQILLSTGKVLNYSPMDIKGQVCSYGNQEHKNSRRCPNLNG